MSTLIARRQKNARKILNYLFGNNANVWIIHYSCESFIDRVDGRSPRITSIALRKLDTAPTWSFSIHKTAEIQGLSVDQIEETFDDLEQAMLGNFFEHVQGYKGMKYLHWNMRDINYGFQAIEHRFQVLQETPYIVDEQNKFDLARLLVDLYGVGYIGHPRMEKLVEKNKITKIGFLNGAEEAKAFDDRDLVSLHRSTLRKVDTISNIANRAHDSSLKTNATLWDLHGGNAREIVDWIITQEVLSFLSGIASIGGIIYAI